MRCLSRGHGLPDWSLIVSIGGRQTLANWTGHAFALDGVSLDLVGHRWFVGDRVEPPTRPYPGTAGETRVARPWLPPHSAEC